MSTAPNLKLVPEPSDLNDEIAAVAGDMLAAKRNEMMHGGVLPPGSEVVRYDDQENARRFLEIVGDDALYCSEKDKWFIWQGSHWRFDRDDDVFDLARNFAASLYLDNGDTKSRAYRNAERANNRSGFNSFLEMARRQQTVSIDDMDASTADYFLNCRNGTLDLRTGELRGHDRLDRITHVVGTDYVADAESDVFNRFITRIIPDDDIRAFVQRSIGYSLLGTVRERSFWILYGTGNNGKSVFTDLFNRLLGDYASATTTASIMAVKQNAIPNDIARLKGKRFVVVPETEENERLNAALIKALSAGDTISARFLFGEFFDFAFTGKLWIATNHKPTVTDHSKGFWDRVKLVPFTQDIPAAEVVKKDDLLRQLMADAPAVLAWAVQGCRDYFEMDGLDVPPVIQAEIDAYKYEQDSIAQFLAERCQTWEQFQTIKEATPNVWAMESEFETANGDMYAAYKKFCSDNGLYTFSQPRLSRNLKERGYRQRNSGGRKWEKIRVLGDV